MKAASDRASTWRLFYALLLFDTASKDACRVATARFHIDHVRAESVVRYGPRSACISI